MTMAHSSHIKKLINDPYNYGDELTIKQLEDIITFTSEKYYNDESVISDAIWDMLVDFLRIKSPKSPVLKNIGAPTKNKEVELPYYLGSMDKIKPDNPNNLSKWEYKYNPPYVLSDKLDGVSGLVVYNNDSIKLYTRGTATRGQDISKLIKYLKLPSYDDVYKYCKKNKIIGESNLIALRGEIIISKNNFIIWSDKYKNARNTVSGIVNRKRINPKLTNDTDFVIYNIVDPQLSILDQYKHIKNMGFNCVYYKKTDKIDFPLLSSYLKKRKDKSDYEVDGIIVTNNDIHPLNTDGNPEYAFAFKDILEDQKAISTIKKVEWKISKDGYINPTLVIEPVDIGGVTIQRITANNAKFVVDNKLGKGAKIELIRSGDVIPKVNKVIKSTQADLPDGNWKWNKTNVDIIIDDECDDINIRNIHFFFTSLKIKGLGERIVEKLYNNGYTSVKQFLQLKKEDLLDIEGFKEKSAINLINAINKAVTNITLPQLMAASNKLGRGLGLERIKSIVSKYPDIMKNKWNRDTFIDNIKSIDGFDTITASLFADNFISFMVFFNSIKKLITIKESIVKKNGKYNNMKIVMSGFRDKDMTEYIEKEGGTIAKTVSKNTDILIIKDESILNTSKVVKAKNLGVKIVLKKNFI